MMTTLLTCPECGGCGYHAVDVPCPRTWEHTTRLEGCPTCQGSGDVEAPACIAWAFGDDADAIYAAADVAEYAFWLPETMTASAVVDHLADRFADRLTPMQAMAIYCLRWFDGVTIADCVPRDYVPPFTESSP